MKPIPRVAPIAIARCHINHDAVSSPTFQYSKIAGTAATPQRMNPRGVTSNESMP